LRCPAPQVAFLELAIPDHTPLLSATDYSTSKKHGQEARIQTGKLPQAKNRRMGSARGPESTHNAIL
jgi:hypothetical protein